MRRALRVSQIIGWVAIAVFFGSMTYAVWGAGKRLDRLESSLGATNGKVQALVQDVTDSVDDNYYELKAQAETTTVILKRVSDLLLDVRSHLFSGKDTRGEEVVGIVPQVRLLLSEGTALTAGMQQEIHRLSSTANDTLKPLEKTLSNLADLSATLDQEVKSGSPKAQRTVELLSQTLVDLDKMLEDPHVAGILSNADAATQHVASSMESIDIGLRPWRQKAALLKSIFLKALGLFRITYGL